MGLVGLCGCAGDTVPTLLPLEPQSVNVNETLTLQLTIQNPDGLPVEFDFAGPPLPSLDLTTTLTGTPVGAVFRWTPLASHVGSHQLDFTVSSSAGSSTQSVVITVVPQLGAAPVFIQPGKGGTYDLDKIDCVKFDLEVKDDDTTQVAILPAATLPQGAQLETRGDKRARLEWCPNDEQVNESLTWILRFQADDGEHTPTQHTYTAVLRKEAKDGCPGTPPTVEVVSPGDGAQVVSSGGFPITIKVTDDTGIRDAPILYYATSEPPDLVNPDPADFEQETFAESPSGAVFAAAIPPLGLAEGEEATVWYFVSAVDNDDEAGTTCDHRTDTDVFTFVASTEGGKAAACDLCTASDGCDTGICAAAGKCVPKCDGCDTQCDTVTTIEGQSVGSCGETPTDPPDNSECTPDTLANSTVEDAVSLLGGAIAGSICAADEADYFSFTSGLDANVTFSLSDLDEHDLDLAIVDASGNTLGVASTAKAVETVALCVASGSTTFAKVYSYQYAAKKWGAYQIEAESSPGDCCDNDSKEPDNSIADAWLAFSDSFEGTLCPLDKDYINFFVDAPDHVEISLDYEGAVKFVDITIHGPLPDEVQVGSALGFDGHTQWNGFLQSGSYALQVLPFGNEPGTYSGTISQGSSSDCDFTFQCPGGTVCSSGQCISENCNPPIAGCPLGHTCQVKKPLDNDLVCAFDCVVDTECREHLGEQCKWLVSGRGCGKSGATANGAACSSFEDCAGGSGCFAWPGGYCARIACTSNDDCGADSRCIDTGISGDKICARTCDQPGDPPCRLDEGYTCGMLFDVSGGQFFGCAP